MLKARLEKLEKAADRLTPPMPAMVIICAGESPTVDEQMQIDKAAANGQHVVVFTTVDAEIKSINKRV